MYTCDDSREVCKAILCTAGVAGASVSASPGLHLQRPEAREHSATSFWPYHADRLRPVIQQWHDIPCHTESSWQAAWCSSKPLFLGWAMFCPRHFATYIDIMAIDFLACLLTCAHVVPCIMIPRKQCLMHSSKLMYPFSSMPIACMPASTLQNLLLRTWQRCWVLPAECLGPHHLLASGRA